MTGAPTLPTSENTLTDAEAIRESVAGILRQGIAFLESLEDVDYNRRVPEAFDSTIGGHYRHCLEHFEPIVDSPAAAIDYDARQRDPAVERDRTTAIRRTTELLAACAALPPESLEIPVRVRYKIAAGATRDPWSGSSLGREAMFAISHAIHHFALIKVMAGLMGVPLPDGFGMAPSTAAFRADRENSPSMMGE